MYLHQMDRNEGLHTTVMIMPIGTPTAPHCIICVFSSHMQASATGGKVVATVYDGFPSTEHTTFGGAFYRALVEHDKALSNGDQTEMFNNGT